MKSLDKVNLFFTLGDLAGIGPEIFFKFTKNLKQLNKQEWELQENIKIILVDELALVEDFFSTINSNHISQSRSSSAICGKHSFMTLKQASYLCKKTPNSFLITGPVSKESLALAGYKFSGQTEALAHINNLKAKDVEMLFIARDFRIILATRHIAVEKIKTQLKSNLSSVLKHSRDILLDIFCIKEPRIGIAGLNPHAGENGLIGDDENLWIKPIINELREEFPDTFFSDPLAADSLLASAARKYLTETSPEYDLYISPYHDQCLPLIKGIAGYQAINMTYGLPFIRVSMDHGCAFDIAGRGIADFSGLQACTEFCINIAKNLQRTKNLHKISIFG